ncbi:MAG: FAD-dependent oxidoreductase, partial [Oscillospiraceae bacterium]|nr:FAD-dependent oxidoreductase [Oscillospiraceae bacterium]
MAKKKIGIIGGGISGAALSYYLSLYTGEAEIVLFEKGRIGCGTTAKSAGTVCLFDDSLNNRYWDVRLYGFETYLKMEQEEKGSAGFDQTGTLVVAPHEQEEQRIKAGIALAKAAGYSGEYITDKARIKEILPDINPDNILGAGYTKDDGYFDGTMISNTFVKKMQANGGTVKIGTEVTEIIREGDTAVALKTADGTRWDFDVIVDCTGPWSRFTGELVGLDVPIWHTKAEAFFLCPPTKRPGYVFPVLKYPAFYALRAGENVFICKSHLSMNLDDPMHAGQWDPDKLPQTGGTDDYFIEFLFEQMDSFVPGLADSGLVSSWLSYRAEPRDFLPIVGETPVKNYLLATGYGGNGVIEAPAVSRDLAKFIMRGESTMLLEE